jgi:uncharacterized protein YndB with AHSA1/START domain
MEKSTNTIEFKFERTIHAAPETAYYAWLDPKMPGTPWQKGDRLIMDAKVNGLFWLLVNAGYPHPHYGRFIELDRPKRIQHTWMSQNTLGEESTVTITFAKKGENTLMTLVHSGLPDTESGRDHEDGWNYFLDIFVKQLSGK